MQQNLQDTRLRSKGMRRPLNSPGLISSGNCNCKNSSLQLCSLTFGALRITLRFVLIHDAVPCAADASPCKVCSHPCKSFLDMCFSDRPNSTLPWLLECQLAHLSLSVLRSLLPAWRFCLMQTNEWRRHCSQSWLICLYRKLINTSFVRRYQILWPQLQGRWRTCATRTVVIQTVDSRKGIFHDSATCAFPCVTRG
jgi:hypothetical protein